MSDKGGAYEHDAKLTGFGAEHPSTANEHREATTPPTGRNELDVKGRNEDLPDPDEVRQQGKTQPRGPSTHEDTKVTRKSEG
ncbi:MAG TPA: hypothetical protein VGR37_20635 [Longimicrobiaceae bacterium]|nr:hypothetical protein [Longimicrobiaceae bacterium]